MDLNGPDIVITRAAVAGEMLPVREGRARVALLSQQAPGEYAGNVAEGLRAEGLAVELIMVPDGEAAKTLAVAEDVYRRLNNLGVTRHDTLLAIGGGSVTDLGGFVAATYLRGIEAVFCPTTLLGAVDAAIGGKTGINVEGKNLVGTFSHPARIVIDLDVLEALPQELRAQGMAEVLKAGLIGDPALVEVLERAGPGADLEEIVHRAVAVKTTVVAEDFREAGRRAILNYGHTIGHAIEVATGISHGEAVAIGMVAAGAVSAARAGFSESARVTAIIRHLGLPTSIEFDVERVVDLIGLDKKRDADGLNMVLLEAIGRPIVVAVEDDAVRIGLGAVAASRS